MPKAKKTKSTNGTDKKKKLFIEKLRYAAGNISKVCDALNIGRRTYYNWLEKDPKFKEAVEDAQEALIDDVESALYSQISNGDTTAMIFFLKTRAKHRGYVEKQERAITLNGSLSISSMKKSIKEFEDNAG